MGWRLDLDRTVSLAIYLYVGSCALVFARAALLDYRHGGTAPRRVLPTALVGVFVLLVMAGLCTALLGGVTLLDRYEKGLAETEYGSNAYNLARLVRCTLTDSVQCTFFARTSRSVLVFPEAKLRPLAPDVGWADNDILDGRRRLRATLSRADKTTLAGMLPFEGTQLFVVQVSLGDVCELMAWAARRGPVKSSMSAGPFAWSLEATVSHTQPSILFNLSDKDYFDFRRSYKPPTGGVMFSLYGVEQSLDATEPTLSERCRALQNHQ